MPIKKTPIFYKILIDALWILSNGYLKHGSSLDFCSGVYNLPAKNGGQVRSWPLYGID